MSNHTSKKNTSSKLALFLIFISPSLSQSLILEGISLGDITLALSLLLLIKKITLNDLFILPKWSLLLFLLLLWISLSGFYASTYPLLFSFDEFIKSYLKILYYIFSIIIIAVCIRNFNQKMIGEMLLKVLFLHSILAIYIAVNQNLMSAFNFSLPYKFLWFGQGGIGEIGFDLDRWIVGGIEVIKLRGIYGEPSLFGVQQIMGIAILLFKFNEIFIRNYFKVFLILITAFLTISFSTIAAIIILFFISVINRNKLNLSLNKKRIIYGLPLMLLFFIFSTSGSMSKVFNDLILNRAVQVFGSGYDRDRSAVMRMQGSYDTAMHIVKRSPIFGSGIGNVDVFFTNSGGQLTYLTGLNGESITISTTIHNIPLYLLGSTGYAGLIIFLAILLFTVYQSGIWLSSLFILCLASTGSLLTPAFWIFYMLYSQNYRTIKIDN